MDHPISSVLTQAAQFTNVAPLATASGYASSDSASVASSVAGDTPVMPNGIFHSTPSSPEAASRKAYQDALWKHTQAQWQGVRMDIENRSRRSSV